MCIDRITKGGIIPLQEMFDNKWHYLFKALKKRHFKGEITH